MLNYYIYLLPWMGNSLLAVYLKQLSTSTGQISVRLMSFLYCLTASIIYQNRRKKAPRTLARCGQYPSEIGSFWTFASQFHGVKISHQLGWSSSDHSRIGMGYLATFFFIYVYEPPTPLRRCSGSLETQSALSLLFLFPFCWPQRNRLRIPQGGGRQKGKTTSLWEGFGPVPDIATHQGVKAPFDSCSVFLIYHIVSFIRIDVKKLH